ncbi:NLPA lipofamily protein [Paraburkholderia xenovorans LB400]|uniref:Outer membrane lipoprotein n=1 Tax=Paraburkholderia xenovorans (strain LB400) TaxID=266265 RepID=Q13ND6_PARXL|nr:MetQ/NlpA family ABC transporter substrate-binding protein [Paraburkholderia xenovorans]ABE34403.1 Putative outer membrane lipoprotein [Paraburkholderia xenovorans LB400]AIP35495.1 NLPA lipofamily protein [Paraburkholderia xenovorans LB400]
MEYRQSGSVGIKFSTRRRITGTLLLAATLAGFTAPTAYATDSGAPSQELRVGFVPGPYADEFKAGVEPQLRKKGYAVRYIEFSTGLEANQAVYRGEIIADVMQHEVYLKSYNDRNGTDLVGVVQVPTPPMGLYSSKHHSLAEVKPGTRVAVPNDPVNLERALKILQRIGWIRIKPNPNPVDVTERDVIANPAGIKIVPLESAQAPRALEDVDYAAIQGNFAIFSGHKLTDALALEEMTPPYINQVVVKASNRNARATQDIVQAYQSADFQRAIRSNRFYDGFRLPAYFSNE